MKRISLLGIFVIANLFVGNLFTTNNINKSNNPSLYEHETDNLLENGDFESSESLSSWEGLTNTNLSKKISHTGFYSARITQGEISQGWLEVDPDQTYTLTAWFNWNKFFGDEWGYTHITIFDENWGEIYSIKNLDQISQPGTWHKFALTFIPKTSRIQIKAGIFGPKKEAEIFLDDLILFKKEENKPPTISPEADIYGGNVPLRVRFKANENDTDGAVKYLLWDFGDGSMETTGVAEHVFLKSGDFDVTLSVWDNDGEKVSRIINILAEDPVSPQIKLNSPTIDELQRTANLSGMIQIADNNLISSIVWDNISTNDAGIVVPDHEEETFTINSIPLKKGENEILITATDQKGKISTSTIYLSGGNEKPQITDVQINSSSIDIYSEFEVTFNVDSVANNPFFEFDKNPPPGVPAEIGISVSALFITPSGKQLKQPAFFTNDAYYENQHYYESNKSRWHIRFSPQEVGVYKVQILAKDAAGETVIPIGNFKARASSKPGFVKVSKDDSRYFEFSNGNLFWPIGPADIKNFDSVSGLNFSRIWLAGTGAYSSNFSRWVSSANEMGNEGFDSQFSFTNHYPTHELSQHLFYPEGKRIWIGWPDPEKSSLLLKNNTSYFIKVRIKTLGITGPANPDYPFGFAIKKHGWPTDQLEQDLLPFPSIIPLVSQDSDWHTIAVIYKATVRDSNPQNPYISLYLDNVTAGEVFIDQFSIKEILADGNLGGELITNSTADLHTYVEPKAAKLIDQQIIIGEESGIFYKYVVHDKRDWIQNHLVEAGFFSSTGDGYFQPEGTKARWLLEQWWRYIIARWGYSPAVHTWELVNEGPPGNIAHYQMAQDFGKFMHSVDSHPHLVTTSFWSGWESQLWNDNQNYPDLDYADFHIYANNEDTSSTDLAQWQIRLGTEYHKLDIAKPIMRGETGIGYPGQPVFNSVSQLRSDVWFHNMLWSQLNPNVIYDPNYWWSQHLSDIQFDEIVPPFKAFIADIPLNKGGFSYSRLEISNEKIRAIGQYNPVSGNGYLWVQNRDNILRNYLAEGSAYIPIPQSSKIRLHINPNTEYNVEVWDTYTGNILNKYKKIADESGVIVIDVLSLKTDVAIKISREMPHEK